MMVRFSNDMLINEIIDESIEISQDFKLNIIEPILKVS